MAVVTGAGSTWSNVNELSVGLDGSGNRLLASDGGTVRDSCGYIGGSLTGSSSHNLAEVTGAGSLWHHAANLFVGYSGLGNGYDTLYVAPTIFNCEIPG